MNTPNQQLPKEGLAEHRNRVTPVTTASNADTGVSVDYIHDTSYTKHDGYCWFAMTATYQRERMAAKHLAEHGVMVFYPVKHTETVYRKSPSKVSAPRETRGQEGSAAGVLKNAHGRIVTKSTDVSLIPNTLFIYTDLDTAERFVRYSKSQPEHLDYLHFLYDKTKVNNEGKNPPLIVSNHQMDNFIDLFSREIEGTAIVDREKVRFKTGDEIIITGGEFKGIRGRVARIGNQTRVIVTLNNICYASTTYVPTKYIEKLQPELFTKDMA